MDEPTLDDVAKAVMNTDGKTPTAVLEAFLPTPAIHCGKTLVPLKAGHELLLSQTEHPLVTKRDWKDVDVLMALFIFSHPSRHLFELVASGDFEAEFFKFVDEIPIGDTNALAEAMVEHWMKARATALAMKNPHETAQKKTAVSVGCSPLSAALARPLVGLRTWLCTTFRFAKYSR